MDVLSWQEFVAGWAGEFAYLIYERTNHAHKRKGIAEGNQEASHFKVDISNFSSQNNNKGVAGLAVGHPADTIKVRQQAFSEKIGVLKTFQTTLKYEGVRGFYKGMSFPLLSAGALNALFFGVYANTSRLLEQQRDTAGSCQSSTRESTPPKNDKLPLNVFAAGCVGGLFACFLACPIDLIKIQMQSQTGNPSCKEWGHHNEPKHRGMIDCIRRLCHNQGIRGLYTGMYPMLLRDVPSYGLYMLAYEHFLRAAAGRAHIHEFHHPGTLVLAGGSADIRHSFLEFGVGIVLYAWQLLTKFTFGFRDVVSYGIYMYVYETGLKSLHWNHVMTTLVSGGCAGVISWALITPLDLIKSRIQADDIKKPMYKGVIDCARKSYNTNGLPVFFRGFTMMMLRSFPVNAATFLVYESTLHLLVPANSSEAFPILHHD